MTDKRDNTGIDNTGNYNSGNHNSGNHNYGDGNSGDGNSGDGNSGNYNSGNHNSGNGNSGYGNSVNRSSGIFCNETPKVVLFNKATDLTWGDIDHPSFYYFELNEWIPESKMTDQEKKDNATFRTTGGYLKTYSYKEAWANFWGKTSEENKQKFLDLPNFHSEVFLDITGIDVRKKEVTCDGKEVEIEGKTYILKLKKLK